MKRYLSYSQISMFIRCGEQYRRRYIEKQIIPPGIALIKGSAVDQSVNRNLGNKIDSGELLPIEQIQAIAADSVTNQFKAGNIKFTDDELAAGVNKVKGETIDSAVNLSMLHHAKFAPIIQPKSVQKKWDVELDNFPFDLTGIIDIVELDTSVRDTKTSGKSPSEDEAENSEQLSLYAFAMNTEFGDDPNRSLHLDYLVDLKTPKTVHLQSTRTEAQINSLLLKIEKVAEAIEKEVYLPADPSNWMCNPKWCGYFQTCKYRQK